MEMNLPEAMESKHSPRYLISIQDNGKLPLDVVQSMALFTLGKNIYNSQQHLEILRRFRRFRKQRAFRHAVTYYKLDGKTLIGYLQSHDNYLMTIRRG